MTTDPVIARNNVTRQSIVSRETRSDKCGSLTGSQWIATGYALAMTRVSESVRRCTTHSVIARRTLVRRGNPSCLEGRDQSMRFLPRFSVDRHGLSPRDDRSEKECEGMRSYLLYADDIARNGAIKAEVVLMKINRTRTWLSFPIF